MRGRRQYARKGRRHGKGAIWLLSLGLPMFASAMPLDQAVRAGLAIHPEVRSAMAEADRAGTEVEMAKGANLELSRAQEQLSLEKGNLQDARNQYAILVGQEPADLVEPEPMSLQRYLAASDMARVIRESPLQRKALEDANVAEAEVREAKASLLPQLNLEASALRREIGGHPESDSVVSLRFRMDTFQGLSNFRRPTAAQQRLESAKWSADAMQRDIRRQLQNLFDNGDTLRWREQSLTQQVTESEQVGELYREQFEVGRRDVIDLLNVQRERFEAERQLINLRIERKRIEYRAAAQVGLLGPLLENRLNHGS